ncbi:TPA: hypothetical protein EYO12_00550 [Candidatus Saccharibacteria bacterium]|nr:hypothetical protein [Candidatus Saccharibacteria bacterium]HIO87585.1 hypothetical protein [Candidatus Saccharibacteria bacterium]
MGEVSAKNNCARYCPVVSTCRSRIDRLEDEIADTKQEILSDNPDAPVSTVIIQTYSETRQKQDEIIRSVGVADTAVQYCLDGPMIVRGTPMKIQCSTTASHTYVPESLRSEVVEGTRIQATSNDEINLSSHEEIEHRLERIVDRISSGKGPCGEQLSAAAILALRGIANDLVNQICQS